MCYCFFAGVAIWTQKGLSVWGIFLSISAMGNEKRWDLNSSYYCHWKQPQKYRCSKACNYNYSVSALLGHITCVCVCMWHACVCAFRYVGPFWWNVLPRIIRDSICSFQSPLRIHSFHWTFTSHLSLLWMCVHMHAFVCVCVCVRALSLTHVSYGASVKMFTSITLCPKYHSMSQIPVLWTCVAGFFMHIVNYHSFIMPAMFSSQAEASSVLTHILWWY